MNVSYKNKATGAVVVFEKGSRAERRCRENVKRYECLTSESVPTKPETKKPEKSG